MTVSGFRVKEVYRASGHVRTSGIVGIGDRALSGFSRLRVLTRNFREIILGKCLRREGQELGIFTRIIGKCRVGYRDKTVEVIGRGLGSCRRLSLTLCTPVAQHSAACLSLGLLRSLPTRSPMRKPTRSPMRRPRPRTRRPRTSIGGILSFGVEGRFEIVYTEDKKYARDSAGVAHAGGSLQYMSRPQGLFCP